MIELGHKEFIDRFDGICAKYAEKTAITYLRDNSTKALLTFSMIHSHVIDAENYFRSINLCSGDRVAIIAPHSPYAIIAVFALAYSNITGVLIDATLPTEEINRLLEYSDVRAAYTSSATYMKLDKTLSETIPFIDINNELEGFSIFSESIVKCAKTATADPHYDVVAILFSSGTTARIKGVMVTYSALIESIKLFSIPSRITDKSSLLYVLPYYHIAGFTGGIACLLSGCDVGMIENVEASKLLKGLIDYQPSIFSMVPKVFDIMAKKIKDAIHEKGFISESIINLLLLLSGVIRKYMGINLGRLFFFKVNRTIFGNKFWGLGTGASLSNKETTRFFLNLGFEWANFYALTETNVPTVSTGVFDRYPDNGVGRIDRYKDIQIKIHAPDKKGVGEIYVKSILMMKGYFRDPELTANSFDEDGFFKTGDLGYIDKHKNLHITGRMKESIHLRTGKKVSPADIDSYYSSLCPDIALASCGIPDITGVFDNIALFIEVSHIPDSEQQQLRKRIIEFSSQSGEMYRIAEIYFVDALPLTSIGKVKRFKLKEIALSANTEGGQDE